MTQAIMPLVIGVVLVAGGNAVLAFVQRRDYEEVTDHDRPV